MATTIFRHAGPVSALISVPVAMLAAAAFWAATLVTGDADTLAQIGGSTWVFLLMMIILMPTVTTLVKRRLQP